MMLYNRLICYLLFSVLFVLFGCSSPNREIQPSQGNQSEQRAIRPVAQTTSSEYRQALVIGNSDYDYAGVLRNPINDAQAISNALGELGFKVRTVIDADKRGMEQAIRSFGKQLRDRKGVGLFYYAGHGMQLDGENYLLPVNINPDTEDDVLYDGVPLGKLLAQMKSAGNGINVVILDACRNNPFARSFRSTSRGLAQVVAPTGSFISYATAPGQIAADGSGENGLYTSKLLKHMVTSGIKLEDVFKRVRVDVQRESNSQQVPWDASSVTGDFYFVTSIAAAPNPNQIDLADLQKRANVEQSKRLEQERARAEQQSARLEQERIKKVEWREWQQKMQQDYERVLAFEKQSIGADLKVESWQRFLDNWADDNPYSTQDAELRSGAQAKVSYWRKELIAPNHSELNSLSNLDKELPSFPDFKPLSREPLEISFFDQIGRYFKTTLESFQNGDFALARDRFYEIMVKKPNSRWAGPSEFWLGITQAKLGDYGGAESTLQDWIDKGGAKKLFGLNVSAHRLDVSAHLALAWLTAKRGDCVRSQHWLSHLKNSEQASWENIQIYCDALILRNTSP